jgi:Ca2+-binding RTX toxin-like protein
VAHFANAGSGYSAGAGLSDGADRYLADVVASVTFQDGGTHYVATASVQENGVSLASVSASGLTLTGALGAADTLPISAPTDLDVVQRLDETLLFLASSGTSSLSVLTVENGVPALADHIYDSASTRFQGAESIAALSYGDFAFMAAGGAEGGVSLLTVLPGGRLVHLGSVSEDETVPLDQIAALDAFVIGDVLNIVAGSANEAGLTRLEYDLSGLGVLAQAAPDTSGAIGTAGDDQLIGSVVGETLSGLGGDDILLDGRGNDILTGGAGADLFVFTADGQSDQITDFERGIDKLDLSAFDFLYGVSQLSIAPTANGAVLSFGNEMIFVTTSDAAPLTALDLTTEDILNVDRPPFLSIGREIIGTSADEVLIGGPGDDTIAGAGGADSLVGGPGLDVLLGSSGNDTLDGQGDRDTLIGGTGDDLIFGGDGGDLIYGDEWA